MKERSHDGGPRPFPREWLPDPQPSESDPRWSQQLERIMAAAITGSITQGQGEKIAASMMLSAKAAVAAILPLRLIAPFSRHATI